MAAYPHRLGVNSLPIRCQSIANPVSIHRQFSANLMPIWCQSDVHRRCPPIWQSNVNPSTIPQFKCNPMKICQSNANGPIQRQSANPMPTCQSNANLPILDQSTNPSIQCQFCINLPIHHQSSNVMPILDQSANESPICQSVANPRIRCQSWTNLQIHHQSANPNPLPIHFNLPIQTQSRTNFPIHQ